MGAIAATPTVNRPYPCTLTFPSTPHFPQGCKERDRTVTNTG